MMVPRLVALTFLVGISVISADNHICNCGFDRPPADEADCAVYGSVSGSEDLIPWQRASGSCVSRANETRAAVDLGRMWTLCPFPNGTNVPTNALVSYIRSSAPEATKKSFQALFPRFFQLNNATGEYEFPPTILTLNLATVDCTGSGNLCWPLVDNFLVVNETARNAVCAQLHDLQVDSLKAEQLALRGKLCAGETIPACQDLADQIQQVVAATGSSCADVAQGPGNAELPDPLTCGESDGGSGAPVLVDFGLLSGTVFVSALVAGLV